ncbi:hypothetical protein A8F94_21955 [Bacillus sp. FJAT-27225]|uniref:GDSL-type esterase/lipase family protein n=1 Tax=Bacillus sp. FJAT-27225 TaxID=1743144 RepID=UPI00080C24CD|nr:GDSL-type esterase/lipase family protein [Bacillus sp. FJAT-27225]OCA81541.1 hypothetical protein A8F94_21955 [Bacillus sp. FJAT-27225]
MKSAKIIMFTLLLAAVGLAAYIIFANNGQADKGKTVIMAFGDSLTYGQGDRDEQGYVKKLEHELNARYPGESYKIENYGVKGRESGGVLKELADPQTAARLKNADYFILFIGTNDFINSNGGHLKQLHLEKIKIGQDQYIQNLELIIDILKTANEEAPMLVLGLYNPYPEGGDRVERILDEWNKATIQLVNTKDQVAYVPTNDLFKGKDKEDYFSDVLHLNENGYKLLGKRILEEYQFDKHK